jgi:hypothetical protein
MSEIGQVRLKSVGIKDNSMGIPIYLSRMAAREKYKINSLPLYKPCKQGEKIRFVITRFFLTGILECNLPGKFVLKVRPNFGGGLPQSAEIRVDKTRVSATLIMKGAPVQIAGLPFGAFSGTDKVVFQVTTRGSDEIPETLYAVLRNIKTDTRGKNRSRAGHG